MKTVQFAILSAIVAALTICPSLPAAPVESVESACASPAFQKVDAFLGEKVVADQLTALGLSQEQAHARLAQLSEAQLEQLAAQVDLIHAGGTIQGPESNSVGPLACWFHQLGTLLYNVFQVIFCWGELK
ncbi:MAG TPA: PA2779 family protein [Verrucomicrobiae bacterium]|nr:PA2779 family protein [Verrucomicrobiae bacterium]